MKNVIEIRGLSKKYNHFFLDNVSFSIPSGFVCGFIGQNGAGKTTTLKLMLSMVIKDSGEINILGKPSEDLSIKDDLGILFDQPYYQEDWTPLDIEKALRPFYSRWNSSAYHQYLQRFSLPPKQKYKTMSRGMKMKLGIAVTLSHDAKLLLLDEPTSGLDPVIRDEILDILRDYMVQENRSIFFSTHITSDLEKIADYITYIHEGNIVYSGLKEELLEQYCLIRGREEDLPQTKRKSIIGIREHAGGFEGMIEMNDIGGFPSGVVTETVSLDDIMVFMNRKGADYAY